MKYNLNKHTQTLFHTQSLISESWCFFIIPRLSPSRKTLRVNVWICFVLVIKVCNKTLVIKMIHDAEHIYVASFLPPLFSLTGWYHTLFPNNVGGSNSYENLISSFCHKIDALIFNFFCSLLTGWQQRRHKMKLSPIYFWWWQEVGISFNFKSFFWDFF